MAAAMRSTNRASGLTAMAMAEARYPRTRLGRRGTNRLHCPQHDRQGAADARHRGDQGGRCGRKTPGSQALARSTIACSRIWQPAPMSVLSASSTSLWLMPSLQGTNTIAVGATRET